jgi:hypothetical protein
LLSSDLVDKRDEGLDSFQENNQEIEIVFLEKPVGESDESPSWVHLEMKRYTMLPTLGDRVDRFLDTHLNSPTHPPFVAYPPSFVSPSVVHQRALGDEGTLSILPVVDSDSTFSVVCTMATIRISTREGVIHEVSREEAICSGLLRESLEEGEEGEEDDIIPLPVVEDRFIKRIFRFIRHHLHDPMDPIIKPFHDMPNLSTWDRTFIERYPPRELLEFIVAVNYLDIAPLLDLVSAQIAWYCYGKSEHGIREIFGLPPRSADASSLSMEMAFVEEMKQKHLL